jgi:hypothetical protein
VVTAVAVLLIDVDLGLYVGVAFALLTIVFRAQRYVSSFVSLYHSGLYKINHPFAGFCIFRKWLFTTVSTPGAQGLTGRVSRRTYEHVAAPPTHTSLRSCLYAQSTRKTRFFQFSQPDRVQDRGGSRSTRIDAEATDPKPPETKRGQKFRKMQKIAKRVFSVRLYASRSC